MRHRKSQGIFGTNAAGARRIVQHQAIQLVRHGSIRTTLVRAKRLRPFIERLVTVAKDNTIGNRRTLFRYLQNDDAVRALVTIIGPLMKSRPGGYTRITRIGRRVGDNAPTAMIAFVEKPEPLSEKPVRKAAKGRAKAGAEKKAITKKSS